MVRLSSMKVLLSVSVVFWIMGMLWENMVCVRLCLILGYEKSDLIIIMFFISIVS